MAVSGTVTISLNGRLIRTMLPRMYGPGETAMAEDAASDTVAPEELTSFGAVSSAAWSFRLTLLRYQSSSSFPDASKRSRTDSRGTGATSRPSGARHPVLKR